MCVHDCQHPLWGGAGFCQQAACVCESGMSTTDSMGRASCVSQTALTTIYLMLAGVGAAYMSYNIYATIKQRRLPTTRRTRLRLRVIWVTGCFTASAVVVFIAAAARMEAAQDSLYESGMLQALYTVTLPLGCSSCAYIAAVWLEFLPAQLLPADNIAVRVRELAQTNHVVDWISLGILLAIAPFGLSTFFGLDALKVVRIVNLTSAAMSACTVISFSTVCFFLTRIIRKAAKRHVTTSGTDFYTKAILTLWVQVAAISIASIVWIAAVVSLEPRLGGIGMRTPIIPLSIMMLDAFAGLSLVVRFTGGGSTNGPRCPASRVEASPNLSIGGRLRAMISSPRAESKIGASRSVVASSAVRSMPIGAPRAASAKRVVPTSGNAC